MCHASVSAIKDCFQAAVSTIWNLYMKKDSSLMENSTIDIGVSYDGSWHRRGHTSHHGVGTIIEPKTGLVIDTYVMSNYCFVCAKGLATSDANYDAWYNNHRTL